MEKKTVSHAYKTIEDKVLRVYSRVSPSVLTLNNYRQLHQFIERRNHLFLALSIPKQLFKGKKLIDIGGGTGEKSLLYAFWGAEVTILDPVRKSCEYAKKLFSKYHLTEQLRIINQSLFEFDLILLQNYDIVVCEGILHSTFDPMKGLKLILKNMKEESIIILGIGETNGWFKRQLQRNLILKLAGSNEKKIIQVSKKYFKKHLGRAVKYGLRSEMAVIYDTWVNPQIKITPLKEICNTFKENQISYISAYPKLDPFFMTIPHSDKKENLFNYDHYSNYYHFLEKIWMVLDIENIKHFDFSKISERVESDIKKLKELELKINNNSFKDKDLRIIQSGYMGIGQHYFVGTKMVNNP